MAQPGGPENELSRRSQAEGLREKALRPSWDASLHPLMKHGGSNLMILPTAEYTVIRVGPQTVKRNRRAAGVDKVSVKMFDANREENLAALMRDLKTGKFRLGPLR